MLYESIKIRLLGDIPKTLGGRKDDVMAKKNIKAFRLDAKETEQLRIKAEKVCMTESALVRSLIADFEPREAPPKEFFEGLKEIRAVGNSLNQIAAKAHTLGYIDTPKLDKALQDLYKFEAMIEEKILLPERSEDGSN